MFKKSVLGLLVLLIQGVCQATMFFPLPFEKQVEEATSAVEVQLASTKVFKNALGAIMTEYSFNVLEAYNVYENDLENQKLKLTMPGGTFEGITSMIDGAPQFNAEEKSFLLLKKIESKIYLSNFTLGKFKIQEQNGKTYYVSEVFPSDPNIGKIAKEQMVELMKTKWKISFSDTPETMMAPGSESRSKPLTALFKSAEKRQPAQEAEEGREAREVPIFFWTAIFTLGFFFAFIFIKLGKSEHQHKSE